MPLQKTKLPQQFQQCLTAMTNPIIVFEIIHIKTFSTLYPGQHIRSSRWKWRKETLTERQPNIDPDMERGKGTFKLNEY